MSQAVALRVPADEEGLRARPGTSTPILLRRLSILVAVAAGMLALVGTAAVALTRNTVDSVGHRTVPAIIDSQKIHEALADADRSAANDFLSGGIEVGGPRLQYQRDIRPITTHLR